jgi:predicted SprT family Zn-dependent metalloprotease
MIMLTTQEVEQYIRLTLKQWKLSKLSVKWRDTNASWLGLAYVAKNEIVLNKMILIDFRLFDEVLKHEIAHFLQYKRNGNKFLKKNGRWMLHGKDFRDVCKEMGIPARTQIPVPNWTQKTKHS